MVAKFSSAAACFAGSAICPGIFLLLAGTCVGLTIPPQSRIVTEVLTLFGSPTLLRVGCWWLYKSNTFTLGHQHCPEYRQPIAHLVMPGGANLHVKLSRRLCEGRLELHSLPRRPAQSVQRHTEPGSPSATPIGGPARGPTNRFTKEEKWPVITDVPPWRTGRMPTLPSSSCSLRSNINLVCSSVPQLLTMDCSTSDNLVNRAEIQALQSSRSEPSLHSSTPNRSLAREVLLFSPNPFQQTVSESFNAIPTCLFRLHASRTVGKTTSAVVSPARLHGNLTQDIFRPASRGFVRCCGRTCLRSALGAGLTATTR